MVPSRLRSIDFFYAILVFFVILTSFFFVESIFNASLHSTLHPFDNNIFITGISSALLATILIVSLFLRTRQLTIILKEKELSKAKEDLENTLNTMTDFVSVHDKDFKVTKVNQSLCEFLGKKANEIIGKPCYQVFHNIDEPYKNCPHKKTFEINHPVTEIINDPNLGVPLQITCSPYVDDGKFKGSLHVARVSEEISNRKKKPGQILPICASCKSIRNNDNKWLVPEEYFIKKHDFQFTHTFCKDCQEKLYPEYSKS